MNHSGADIKRILIVRTDRLGDVILTLPMLPALRSRYPGAYIAMLLRRYTGAIIEGNPYVDELLWYDNGAELIPFAQMRRILKERKFEAVVVVYPTLRLAWLVFRAGIPLRVGTGYRYYSFLFNRRVFEHRSDARRHEVEYNLNLLRELQCPLPVKPEFFIDIPQAVVNGVEERIVSAGIRPGGELVILHPGSGGSAREWGVEQFGRLAARLSEHPGVHVAVTGSREEAGLAEEVVRLSGGKALSMAGKLGLKELSAFIRMSSLFVSNSTGPIHVAAAMGIPIVGLYPQHTPMSARRWGPYSDRKVIFTPAKPADCDECSGRKGEPCECMQSISVDQVYQAACSLLPQISRSTAGAAGTA